MAKILFIDGKNIKALDKIKFTEESKLQDYLEKYPSLIPLTEIAEGAPDLLCIGREVNAGLGAADLLFIDKDGLLTIVETKLVKNPEIHRAVIGQLIEYASFISQWTADDVYRIADDYQKSNLDEVIQSMSEGAFSSENFRSNIEQNLRNGMIRLIIAIDELIEPLRATVTFLNSYSNFDILLLQVSSFQGKEREQTILAPSLFGYATKTTKTSLPRKQWNLERFLADTRERCESEIADVITKLYDFTKSNADNVFWGTGAYIGSFTFHKLKLGAIISIFSVYSDGWIYLNFGYMKDREVKEELLESFKGRLNEIPNVSITKDVVTSGRKFPTIKVETLTEPASLRIFEDAVLTLCQQLESSEDD